MTADLQRLEFGEWLPDLPPLLNPGAIEARNVVAQVRSYRAVRALLNLSTSALTNPALGFFWLQDSANNAVLFAGDQTRLYQFNAGTSTWDDVSRPGLYTAVTNWAFTKFGNFVIAVATGEPPQIFEVGVSATFTNLTGSPPEASRIATVRDFVVLGDLSTGAGRLQWSGFNNATLWTPSRATQSDFQDIRGRAGRIQAIVPGSYGVVFLEHSIYRMDYSGPPITFTISEVEPNRGTPAPNSVTWTGRQIYYYSHDGFYVTDGVGQSRPIGVNRVDRWFRDEAAPTELGTMRGAVDRRNRLVMWAFKAVAGAPSNDRLIIYNWGTDRWSYAVIDTQLISDTVSSGLNLDQLDNVLTQGIDITSISVDSTAFQGGALDFAAFDNTNRFSSFAGNALDAVLDTKEIGDSNGGNVNVNAVRPLVDGNNPTVSVQLGSRGVQTTGAPVFGMAQSLNSIGEANFRDTDRYQRVRVNISGEYDHAIAIMARVRQAGRR